MSSKKGMPYARLYYEGKTYNLGSFATHEEVLAARRGALAMLQNYGPKLRWEAAEKEAAAEKPQPKPKLSMDAIYDKLRRSIQLGQLDPFLDELALEVKSRGDMLKNLPKQVGFGRPVIAPRPRP